MASSTFYAKPIVLNENYKPLKHEHSLLQYYFKESFILIDSDVEPSIVLMRLLDKYLNLKMDKLYPGRIINQKNLAQKMKKILETMPKKDTVTYALDLLNEITHTVHPKDDLIYLLSAYCSIFPFTFPLIKNKHIKDMLIIRDINNIYFHSILKKSLKYSADHNLLVINNKTIKLSLVTNQYEWLLRIFMNKMNIDTLASFVNINILLKFATTEQVDTIVLPVVMKLLKNNINQSNKRRVLYNYVYTILNEIMPSILTKVSVKSLETIIIPRLLELCRQEDIPTTKEILLKCIERMDADALKRCFFPALIPYCLNKEKHHKNLEGIYEELHEKLSLELCTAIISKFSQRENDFISEQLVPKIQNKSIYWLDNFLKLLKELRRKQLYVNENLFQLVNDIILQSNDKILENFETWRKLFLSHMTAKQIQCLFSKISFEEEYKKDDPSFFAMLIALSDLSVAVYPMSLWNKSFEYIYLHYISSKENTKYLPALIKYLKNCEFNTEAFQKILINLSIQANENIQMTNRHSESRALYSQLLETCTSLLTEQQIKRHIVSMIDMNQLIVAEYARTMHGTMYQIFSKVNDEEIHAKFFKDVVQTVVRNSFSECDDLLELMIYKVKPVTLIYTVRQLLNLNISNFVLDRIAYVLALFYEKNKESLNTIPGFCTGEQYEECSTEAKFANIRKVLLINFSTR